MNLLEENWDQIIETIRTEYDISEIRFNTWIKPLKPVSIEKNVATIAVPSNIKTVGINYISERYKLFFQITIGTVLGIDDCDVEFIWETDIPEQEQKEMIDPDLAKRLKESRLDSKYTFESFVVGSNSKFAQAAALAVAENPGVVYNPLYIYGGAGLGKTHLMHSIGHYILENDKKSKVLYVTSEEFTNELIETIRNGNNTSMSKFRDKYRNIDVLLLDDIQFIIGKESTQEEFFHTFNTLHSAKKQIILSSDKPPKDLEILEERFRSRFEWGLIADISLPDYETRMAILHKKEEMENIDIDEEIIKYIANNIKSNIRELEGALNKIAALSRLETREITLDIAKEVLRDIISPDRKKAATQDDILYAVSEYYNVSIEDLKSDKRSAKIMEPRQVCMYLCRELTSSPYKSIGAMLGNRDHTTVINGIKKIEKELDTNENMRVTIEILKKKLS